MAAICVCLPVRITVGTDRYIVKENLLDIPKDAVELSCGNLNI